MMMLVLHLMGKNICLLRVILAGLWEAGVATIIVYLQIPFDFFYIFMTLFVSMIGVKVALSSIWIGEIFIATVYFYSLSFVFSKLYWIGAQLFDQHEAFAMILSLCMLALLSVIFVKIKNTKSKLNIYRVSIVNQGKTYDMFALYDTGNSLTDPISGKSVSVVETDMMRELKNNTCPQKFKVIPYHTIGQENGILEGTQVEELTIWKGKQKVTCKNPIIAFYDGKLSKNGNYHMILNLRLLLGER